MLELFMKNCRRDKLGSMGEGECEDEGPAELLTINPIAYSWCIPVREGLRNSGVK